MVISHDRWFLDRICTHILAAEGDSQWVFFPGNYQEYEADKVRRLGEEGARPKRMRFKPTTERGPAAHASPTRRATARRASGATTSTTGKAMSQAVSQALIHRPTKASTRPTAR